MAQSLWSSAGERVRGRREAMPGVAGLGSRREPVPLAAARLLFCTAASMVV